MFQYNNKILFVTNNFVSWFSWIDISLNAVKKFIRNDMPI